MAHSIKERESLRVRRQAYTFGSHPERHI
uniref:Uncharacterized protein n=1 Tax=Moniliophthora roreri TaxID=221103 RepID=A0A0W0FJG5_MONRR